MSVRTALVRTAAASVNAKALSAAVKRLVKWKGYTLYNKCLHIVCILIQGSAYGNET